MPRTRTPKHRSFSTPPRPEPERSATSGKASRAFEPSPELADALATIVAGGAPAVSHALALIDADRDAAALERLRVAARERADAAFRATLDWPDRPGGVRPNDEGGYDRIDDDESPFDLAGETQRRREARGNVTADGFVLYTDPEPLSEFARRVGALEALWRKS